MSVGYQLRVVAITLVASTALTTAPFAHADAVPGDSVVFARDQALWQVPARRRGEPVRVAKLPGAHATRIVAARAGILLLVRDNKVSWVRPNATVVPTPTRLDCGLPADLSPNGRCLVCTTHAGEVQVHLLDNGQVRDLVNPRDVQGFLGPDGRSLVVSDSDGIWAVKRRRRRLLAADRPENHLMVAPDGRRAVASYREGDTLGLYSFRLDGKAARRLLLENARPVAWSVDSRWVLAQHDKRGACIMRAVGGQYKCWRNYQAIAIAPDGNHAILARSVADRPDKKKKKKKKKKDREAAPAKPSPPRYDLYWAELEGAHTKAPRRRLDATDRAAAWLPTP